MQTLNNREKNTSNQIKLAMTIMFLCFQSRVSDICSHLSSPKGRAIPPHHELDSRDNLKTSNVGSSLKKKKDYRRDTCTPTAESFPESTSDTEKNDNNKKRRRG